MNEENNGKFPFIPRRYKMHMFASYSNSAAMFLLFLAALCWLSRSKFGIIPSDNAISKYLGYIPENYPVVFLIILGLGLIGLGYSYPMMSIMFKKPKFDKWIWEIASKRVGTEIAAYDGERMYLQYDISLTPNNVKEFVQEMNDKSEKFTYYQGHIDIDNAQFSIIPVEKQDIPNRAVLDVSSDTAWSIVPLGKTVNNKTKSISDFVWKMNTATKRKDIYDTIKSMSLLISGGTGSGKSVLQQSIVGHMSRNSDHIQTIGIDVKMVEFIRFEKVKSFKRIALTVPDAQKCIKATQDFMYKRYAQMKENKVNNIEDLKGKKVKYYKFMGGEYQFDELMPVRVDGEFEIFQIEEVYNALKEGKKVELLKVVD